MLKMSRYLPYVVAGDIWPGTNEPVPGFKGSTSSPMGFQPYVDQGFEHKPVPDPKFVEKEADKTKPNLGDEDLIKAIKQLVSDPVTKAMPSDLSWRS